jgi:hypothetical protein
MFRRSELKDRISEKMEEFTAEFLKSYPKLLEKYPLHMYDKEIRSYTEYYKFNFFGPKLVKIFDVIEKQHNAHALALYHKLSLSAFIINTLEKLDYRNVPEQIITLYNRWFERVYRDFSTQPDSYYHHEKANFRKDLAVCRQKAIPVGGAWIVELSNIRTKYLQRNTWPNCENKATIDNKPLRKRIRIKDRIWPLLINSHLDNRIVPIVMLILKRLGVYKSYYVIHTFDRYLLRFTNEHMNRAYLNISELLKIHSDVCGIYRTSWFLDPNLEDISPHLSFLWKVPQQNGARLFCTRNPAAATKKAIRMSPIRKRLYEKGEYRPMYYAYVWPREKFLNWADEQSFLCSKK